MIAVCKWFKLDKGFGFLQPEDGGADMFVHISELRKSVIDTLNTGDRVSFDTAMGKNGRMQAVNVKLV
jgi:cold shock protein